MHAALDSLQPYPFEKLAQLKAGITPPPDITPIALSIGEPQGPAPHFIREAVTANIAALAHYPTTLGTLPLREAIASWLNRRFQLGDSIRPEHHVIPLNGTREGLFSFAQAMIDNKKTAPAVLMPNPFYQIYEGAALLAGAEPILLNCTADNGFIPDFSTITPEIWKRCQLLYLCSPGNPTGAVISQATLTSLIQLAHQYHFIIVCDECYSEIYFDEDKPPIGLLQAAYDAGYTDYSRCIVFHSLSKRSNVPGLRSGFAAGDATILQHYLRYRTYHGCAMPPTTQAASTLAWQDEQHVIANREQYRAKFNAVLAKLSPVMDVSAPDAGFYLWAKTPISDTTFSRLLYEQQHLTVLPGQFLARDTITGNPGHQRIRMALVASLEQCITAADRIHRLITTL